ncbi:hypothetical protein [Deinococcus soli (ex Cha et al. 2016)]|uniref:Uncharacterized protein n=1 Tax=Deinococcus soli (ex Cha et al. 2016) TaxID=1309411 RepID=A0A0F7JJT9_9DEIO|nr:hypothetical protein [Deinococcus soli (ex Cha et al. 2016)]AKH15962.1 hypothetical protein SY84_01635 [Deinococcus soli (ex Cha et al. 2016)]
MSTIKPTSKHAGRSARDLTPYQWRAAKLVGNASSNDTRTVEQDQVIDVAGAGDHVAGVIEYPGDAAGVPTTILTGGRLKIKLGFAGKANDRIKPGANGVALLAGVGEAYFGTLVEAGPIGAVVPFEFDHGTNPGEAVISGQI